MATKYIISDVIRMYEYIFLIRCVTSSYNDSDVNLVLKVVSLPVGYGVFSGDSEKAW